MKQSSPASKRPAKKRFDFDAIVVGAGFGGLRMLLELRKLGVSTRLLEAGTNVGGTWYWNRYPGARDRFGVLSVYLPVRGGCVGRLELVVAFPVPAGGGAILNYVTDRLDLRKDIEFASPVKSAVYDEASGRWRVTTDDGRSFTCTYLVSATGVLSAPLAPPVPGVEDFQGKWYRSGTWPKEQVDLRGKRVGIIGTGATAVQIIPIVALEAAHLTVFQRTPNYVIPARNHPLDEAERRSVKADYQTVWQKARQHPFAMAFDPAGRIAADVTPEQRELIFERYWEIGGFRFVFETFDDIITSETSNDLASAFIRRKIRSIVKDPKTAELLCPKDHPLGSKRPPLGHYYYETVQPRQREPGRCTGQSDRAGDGDGPAVGRRHRIRS